MLNEKEAIAVLIVRLFLGVLFLAQGYDKVFKIGIGGVVQTFEHPLISRRFPKWLLYLSAVFTSYIELIGGCLLIIGFMKYYVLYLLGIDLLMVGIAFSIIQPMWDMQHVFPRLILLIVLLLVPAQWDVYGLDQLWTCLSVSKQ